MTEILIRQAFKEAGAPLPQLRFLESTGSTNDDALRWAEQGAVDGALVVADRQNSGRGRLGRRWVTQPGAALAFSMILHPSEEEAQAAGLFSPLGGMALHQALLGLYGLQTQIKWPNDVLLSGRKISGILAESCWQDSQIRAVVLGIGVNIAREAVPPPEFARFPAGCIEDFLQDKIDRWMFLAHLVKQIWVWRPYLLSEKFNNEWNRHLAFRGGQVVLQNSGGSDDIKGTLVRVNLDGSLLVDSPDGSEHHVSAGDVHLRPLS